MQQKVVTLFIGVRNCKIFKNSLSYGDLVDGLLVSFSTQKETLMSSGKRPGLKRRKVGILSVVVQWTL